MTRNVMKILGALAVVGAVAVTTARPSSAQGFYFSGPGFSFGIGTPWYGGYYAPYYYGGPYYYGRSYAYYPYHRYWRWHHYRRWHHW